MNNANWLRATAVAFACLVAYESYAVLAQILGAWPALQSQLSLPYALNSWADQPMLVMVHRMLADGPAYKPVYDVDSFTYGPVYPFVMAWTYKLFAGQPMIVRLHLISLAYCLAAVLPLMCALVALRKPSASRRPVWAFPLAAAFTLVMFVYTIARQVTVASLHPDVLTFLFTMSAISLALWYPRVGQRMLVLGVLLLVLWLDALAKLNTLPLIVLLLSAMILTNTPRTQLPPLTALGALAFFGASLLIAYLAAPQAMRNWTFWVPKYHVYSSLSDLGNWMWHEWTVAQPWQGMLLLVTITVLITWAITGRPREALFFMLTLSGVALCGLVARLKVGGGPNDVWILYLACLVPLGAFLEDALQWIGEFSWQNITRLVVAGMYVVTLPMAAAASLPQAPVTAEMRKQLDADAAALHALCKPGTTIIVTWFADPLIDCQFASFPLWDTVEEVTWARDQGYVGETRFDAPIAPGVLLMLQEWPVKVHFAGRYHLTQTLPMVWGTSYGYGLHHLQIWEKY